MTRNRVQTPSLQATDIKLLRVFDAVARNNGFAAAQAELNMSPSSISEHMTRLEARLGIKLCERGRGGFYLTEDGRQVLAETRRVLKSLESFRVHVDEIKGQLSGTLHLGMVDAIAMSEGCSLPNAINAFRDFAPNVTLRIETDTTQGIVSGLMSERYDIALLPIYRDLPDLDLVSASLVSVQHLYCSESHPLFEIRDSAIDSEALENAPYVALTFMQGWAIPGDVAFNEMASTSFMECVAVMILSGRFIGYLPEHYADPWVQRGAMRPILTDRVSYRSTCYFAVKRSRTSRLAAAFMEGAEKLAENR